MLDHENWRWIWSLVAPKKIKILVWLIMHGALLTNGEAGEDITLTILRVADAEVNLRMPYIVLRNVPKLKESGSGCIFGIMILLTCSMYVVD